MVASQSFHVIVPPGWQVTHDKSRDIFGRKASLVKDSVSELVGIDSAYNTALMLGVRTIKQYPSTRS